MTVPVGVTVGVNVGVDVGGRVPVTVRVGTPICAQIRRVRSSTM